MTPQKPGNRMRSSLLTLSVAVPLLALWFTLLMLADSSQAAYAATKVGLVTDIATLSDKGLNWVSYQGLLRAQDDFGIVGTVYTSISAADYTPNLQQCVVDGNALCISIGFPTSSAMSAVAAANPTTKFAILDSWLADYPSNLRGVVFYVNDAAYLAGVLAASMSQTGMVADIGAMEIPPIWDYTLPFRNGARCASPGATALLAYAGDFGDPDLGAQVAQSLIAQGADVVLGAGGASGAGVVLTATQSGKWGIGIDVDYYYALFDSGAIAGSDRLLTSVVKKLDTAVYLAICDVMSDTFTAGTVRYGLAEDGVGLAPYHEADSAVPSDVKAYIEQVRLEIIAGRIDVNRVFCHCVYLPLIWR